MISKFLGLERFGSDLVAVTHTFPGGAIEPIQSTTCELRWFPRPAFLPVHYRAFRTIRWGRHINLGLTLNRAHEICKGRVLKSPAFYGVFRWYTFEFSLILRSASARDPEPQSRSISKCYRDEPDAGAKQKNQSS